MARFIENIEESGRFFMGEDKVHDTLFVVTKALEDANIPYAVVGALALNIHGYRRVTVDVDLLMTRESLAEFKARYLGLGFLEVHPGSKAVRDTRNRVKIDFLITGGFPGDGKPKPIAFPDPREAAVKGVLHGKTLSVLTVPRLLELKLASGMSAPHRIKDLADVLEWARHTKLPREISEQLDESVRAKYLELWDLAQTPDPIAEDL